MICQNIETSTTALKHDVGAMFQRLGRDIAERQSEAAKRFTAKHNTLLAKQRRERECLKSMQTQRMEAQNKVRASRFRHGLGGLWDRLRCEHSRIQSKTKTKPTRNLRLMSLNEMP